MRHVPAALRKLALIALFAAGGPALADEADEHFKKGKEASSAGDYKTAEREYQAAWNQRKAYDVAANLAQMEIELGEHREAAEHLLYALRHFPAYDAKKAAIKVKMEEALAQEKKEVGTLRVKVNVPGAAVYVNEKLIEAELLADEVYVDAGDATIEAKASGYRAARQQIKAEKGKEYPVALELVPDAGPPAVSAVPSAAPSGTASVPPAANGAETPSSKRSMVPAFVIGGVGLAALIAGGALVGVAEGKKADVFSKMPRDAKGNPLCGQSAPAGAAPGSLCDQLRARAGDVQTLGNASIAMFAIGGAAAVAAIAYWAWPSKPAGPGKPAALLVPVLAADGGGLQWTGSF
jgi:tetratricopeptide (TPR) repeat protein